MFTMFISSCFVFVVVVAAVVVMVVAADVYCTVIELKFDNIEILNINSRRV